MDGAQVVNNLLTDGSFEAGKSAPGWANVGSMESAAYNTPGAAKEGNWFMQMNAKAADGSAFFGQDIHVVPQVNQSYTFSVWLRSDAGTPININLYLAADGGTTEKTPLVTTVSSTTWTLYSVPLDVTLSGHTLMTAGLYIESPAL